METKMCLGTAAIGRPVYINIKQKSEKKNFDINEFKVNGLEFLNYAYKVGIKHFDTAPSYGIAETMIAEWIRSNNINDVEISSKWGYSYEAGFKIDAQIHELKEHSLEKLNLQWIGTKKSLPYLKIYQIHSATIESGVLENSIVLDKLYEIKKEHGLAIGLTCTGAKQSETIKKALAIKINNESLFTSVQVTYNVFEQSIMEISSYIRNHGVNLIIKESMANGKVFKNNSYPHHNNMYQLIDELCHKYATTPDAIALRFVIDSISPNMLLIGAATQEQLQSNLNNTHFVLEKEDIQRVEKLKQSPSEYWNERSKLEWN